MKVLLMLPIRKERILYVPDLGLGYLATALRQRMKESVSVHLLINHLSFKEELFKQYLIKNHFDLTGIKVFGTSTRNVQRTIKLIREALPYARIVIGGPQVNGDPENVLDYIPADYAIAGEAETGFPLLVEELSKGCLTSNTARGIPGLIWKENGRLNRTQPVYIDDLDMLGFPGETMQEIKMTLDLAFALDLKYARFAIFTPEPGSVLYNQLKSSGRIGEIDYNNLDTRKFLNNFSECPPKKLVMIRDWATFFFHLRPKIIIGMLKEFGSPEKLLLLVRMSFGFLFRKMRW